MEWKMWMESEGAEHVWTEMENEADKDEEKCIWVEARCVMTMKINILCNKY